MTPDFKGTTQKQTTTQGKYGRNNLKTQPDPFHHGFPRDATTIRGSDGVFSNLE